MGAGCTVSALPAVIWLAGVEDVTPRWLAEWRSDRAKTPLAAHFVDALADGTPIDRADGTALDLSETEAIAAWRAGVALVVRS